jgi:hypothetical protein
MRPLSYAPSLGSTDSPAGFSRAARVSDQTTIDLVAVRPSRATMSLVQVGVRLVAKFFSGVIAGIFLGATVSVYGAVASRPGSLSGWAVTKHGEAIIVSDRPVSAGGVSKS